MIFADMPLYDRDLVLPPDFSDQIPHPQCDFAGHGRPALLGDSDQREVNLKNRVRPVAIFLHPAIVRERGAFAKAVA
jgi:hypothetical protein